ncbi:MAG: dTDP-glucose 4,6-dehydratase [Ignavibacteria bacterium]|nr:dTDP-glucose 4,6-dehydratase [Ignavibacteria bacterium]
MTILITGGAGFIGSNFVRYMLLHTEYSIVVVDALTYAGNPENLADFIADKRLSFIQERIEHTEKIREICNHYGVEGIINFAAETHVDRSIMDPSPFVTSNVMGTVSLLNIARELGLRYVQISTDEVYGSLGDDGYFTEHTPLQPSSPYSASKASADMFVQSFVHTFGVNASITRCSNNYGPYQFPEKLIPLMIVRALENTTLPVYGDGKNVRDWIHVDDHNSAVWAVYCQGKKGEVYNIGASSEQHNIDIVKKILSSLGKSEHLITYVKDRPGHDRRYAIDSTKIMTELGWRPQISFADGLESTIEWYCTHQQWCNNIRNGDYQRYYQQLYGKNI